MKALVSIVAMLAIATAAQAALTYSVVGVPTNPAPPGAPGMMTYTLSMSENDGDLPVGFTILIGGGGVPVQQINPAGQPTVFADNNGFFGFVGATVDQDSQFPYLAAAGPTQEVVSGPASAEGPTFLNGDWAFLGGINNPKAGPTVVVAQVVIPVGATVPFSSTVVEYNANNALSKTLNLNGVIPEPATLTLLAFGAAGVLLRRKR